MGGEGRRGDLSGKKRSAYRHHYQRAIERPLIKVKSGYLLLLLLLLLSCLAI
jgi:hypothetical protein